MQSPTKTSTLVPDKRPPRGVLDTSVVIDLDQIEASALPVEVAVTAIIPAELAVGPHAATDSDDRARRQDRLQRAESVFDPLPFDNAAARAYGRIYAAVLSAGRKTRGARAVDFLIAAVACSEQLPLFTRNPGDFQAVDDLVTVHAV